MQDYLPLHHEKSWCRSKYLLTYTWIILSATHGYTWLKAWRAIGCILLLSSKTYLWLTCCFLLFIIFLHHKQDFSNIWIRCGLQYITLPNLSWLIHPTWPDHTPISHCTRYKWTNLRIDAPIYATTLILQTIGPLQSTLSFNRTVLTYTGREASYVLRLVAKIHSINFI